MNTHALTVLDFPRVLELLAKGAASPYGRDLCQALRPAEQLEHAEAALGETADLLALEPILGLPDLEGIQRVDPVVTLALTPGACLEIGAFLAVRDVVGACHRLLEYLEDAAGEGSPLGCYALEMRPLHELADRFERTFGARGEVLDGASPELRRLREEGRSLRVRILRKLEAVLRATELEPTVQEEFITLRHGRYVIPLRTDFRGYLKGIVHDRSRSGQTFFVEPLEVVELNNELGVVHEEEAAEIHRILRECTAAIGAAAPAIRGNLGVAARIDLLCARLQLARRLNAARPRLLQDPVLDIRGARHPLLELQTDIAVVPVDLSLGGERRLLLVTGANAGGKTVALKTMGLLAAMAHAGLFIPAAADSVVGWFRGVYADIGDEQDIDAKRSTFSAHIGNLCDLLEEVCPGDLVLLDELGTGTDPTEGVGLAMAILETLVERGALVMGTTHLPGLKAFAYARSDAENAAVAFDPNSGLPLFRLDYGRAGASNAFEVAERLGMPREVLRKARAYAAGGMGADATAVADIERARLESWRAQERANRLEEELRRSRDELKTRLAEVEQGRQAARREALAEARQMIGEQREDLRRSIRRFAQGQERQQSVETEVAAVEQHLLSVLSTPAEEPVALPDLTPGSRVFVRSLGRDGTIEGSVPEGRKVRVAVGTLHVQVDPVDLAAARGQGEPGGRSPGGSVRVEAEPGSPEVMVIGCTVDEALVRVEKALDRAILSGLQGVRVVHGKGAGVLRSRIREHLAEDRQVRELHPEFDDGATWVVVG